VVLQRADEFWLKRGHNGGRMPIRLYSTSTSARLETLARQLGLRVGISYGEGDKVDRYFIVSANGTRLERLVPLGWTGPEAETELTRLAEKGL
jgi:hypothetical protein